jgi:hypothetical protein
MFTSKTSLTGEAEPGPTSSDGDGPRRAKTRRAEMETKVHEEADDHDDWSDDEREPGRPKEQELPGGLTNDDGSGDGWFEPPPYDGGQAPSHQQLKLPVSARTLTSEDQLQLQETLRCFTDFETDSPGEAEALRKRVDEWTSAVEAGDALAAIELAVGVIYQLNRLAVGAAYAPYQKDVYRIANAARWWTIQALVLLDSLR